ncbi:MAG: HAD-IC family P-type ATPase, partial [Candidatus Pacearchaeota archaeon]|nr:HAD-IC family P-type ATPase [Candidatus Pacearchaeota archaeon]
MEKGDYYSKDVNKILSELNTSRKGLDESFAQERLREEGENEIKRTHRLRPFKIFVEQFNSFLIYILLIAATISFVIDNFVDGVVISIIVIVNGIIGFTQQYKAEKAIINLKSLIVSRSRVIRDGKIIEINSKDIVRGDLILLEAGNKVNADCRIIESDDLQTNEAVLTGESLPVSKNNKKLLEDTILAKRNNMLYAGTQVVRGSAKAIVVAIGMKTEFGKIAEGLQEIEVQKTPMQKRLNRFSKQIGIITILFVMCIALLGFVEKFHAFELFLTSVALAVSAIPEGLPAVLTISFAISSILMAKRNVITRRLPAVETLGSVTVICSDKTGTLTEEQMKIQKIFSNNKFYIKKENDLFYNKQKVNVDKDKELFKLVKTSVMCNNARYEIVDKQNSFFGDPTETALIENALELGIDKKSLIEDEPSLKKFEFSSERKMMSVIRDNGRHKIMYSKGAIERILKHSSSELIDGQIKKLTNKRKNEIIEKSRSLEKDALRVLAFAYKNFSKGEKIEENGLIFLGLAGMIDPPRKEIKNAIKESLHAGIKFKIITGDALLTAVAIAKQVGIKGHAITGKELKEMSDSELEKQIDNIAIFARTDPKQKLRITKMLQKLGEIVAITGDGINDTLALKSADIGISMGTRGTDVARDVSDVVLIDDNFASIVEGIKQGRKTYDNIKKFTKYLLAVNFSEIFLILTAVVLAITLNPDKWFLPLLPLQILWINLVTDSFPALSLIFEKEEDVMNSKPRSEKSLLDDIWRFIIIGGILTFATKFV